jgi:hypothetical protein
MKPLLNTILLLGLLVTASNGFAQMFFEVETVEEAKLKVFAVEAEAEADLFVYFVYEKKDVTKVGYWMEVSTPQEAQILLIFVDDPAQADIKIWLVDAPEQAGWRNESKKDVIKVPGLN